MKMQDYLLKTKDVVCTGGCYSYQTQRKRITCKDGLSFSVQAGEGLYCSPRNNNGLYYEAEIGFPSEKIEKLMPYAEDPENPTETVYGYVPLHIIDDIIEEHGGFEQ